MHEHGSQTDVRLSFHTPGVTSPEAPTLLLLARVLDDGLSTRVHHTICEERGLAYDAFAGNDAFEDCGVFDFGASVEHSKTPLLVETVFELIDELRRNPPTEEEVDKARRRYLWDLQTVRDDPEGAAHFVGGSALFGLPERIGTMAEQVARVSPDDIQRVVQRYLDPSGTYVTCVGVLDDALLSSRARPRRGLVVEVHPVGAAIGTPLLLPKRHGLFDSIDRLSTRGESVVSMCCARRDADCNVPNAELSDPMDRGDPDARMFGGHAFEHALHLFVREALVGLVVEPGDLFAVGVIADDSMEDANASRSWVLHRLSDFIE